MRRTAVTAIAATAVLTGCGNERTPPPDVTTPGPPIGAAQARYPEHGIAFLAPGGWRLTPGTAPLVVTAQTGQATLAVWRYPRTEPLPRTSAHLRAARDALVAEAQRRDPSFKLEQGRVTTVGGAPAVQLRATETINGLPRKVRSTHVYARGAEIVFDAYTTAEHFDRVDVQVFRPVLRTLKITTPRAPTSRRAFVVVLDACGAGELPDAAEYGDAGSDTLVHVAEAVGGLDLPTLGRLGLGSIRPLRGVPATDDPVLHGRLYPLGRGKDSTAGHWELMGVVPPPMPTYPDGFPDVVLASIREATGREFCCNAPRNGISAIDEFGEHHLRAGELILYTSQDSVMQVAAHLDVMPESQLHETCAAMRDVMSGEHSVGRVIARPFRGEPGHFVRTDGRRDFALAPPDRSYLDEVQEAGLPVHSVGKVTDLFDGVGIDHTHPGATNAAAVVSVTALLGSLETGLVIGNLIETDQVYGHRKDVVGFHRALRAIDDAVAGWMNLLRPGDLLVLTSDHGLDPAAAHTDHTREHALLLAVFDGHGGRRHDGPLADVGASALRWLTGRDSDELPGASFV